MTILAIDTSSAWCSVALLFDDLHFDLKHEELGSQSSQFLLPWVSELMDKNGLKWDSIKALAVSQGPGAFTGVRLGVGAAQGLAFANKKPLIPVASLDGLASYQHFIKNPLWHSPGVVLVAIDARMDQVFWAKYQTSSQMPPQRIGNIELSSIEDVELIGVNAIVGNALIVYPNRIVLDASVVVDTGIQVVPNALGVARFAQQIASDCVYDAADCQPLYVRDKVAQTIAERNLAKLV